MKILAIESASLVASVAIATEDSVIAEYTTDHKKTHSQTLMPMIDEICKMTQTELSDIDAVAVSKGPGSFTGLRIGAATAKGLCLALNKKIVPVSTLETMAYNFAGFPGLIVPIMDARRNQVYTGIYCCEKEYEKLVCEDCAAFDKEDLSVSRGLNRFNFRIKNVMDDTPMAIEDLLEKLELIGEDVVFLGDGVPAFCNIINNRASFPYTFAQPYLSRQKASAMAEIAVGCLKQGLVFDADSFAPEYYRLSQAEREKMEHEENR